MNHQTHLIHQHARQIAALENRLATLEELFVLHGLPLPSALPRADDGEYSGADELTDIGLSYAAVAAALAGKDG